MWHLTGCKILFSLSFLTGSKNKMIFFYRISELMLPTLIRGFDKKNHFIYDPVIKQIIKQRDSLKFYSLSGATFDDCINTIYQFIKARPQH